MRLSRTPCGTLRFGFRHQQTHVSCVLHGVGSHSTSPYGAPSSATRSAFVSGSSKTSRLDLRKKRHAPIAAIVFLEESGMLMPHGAPLLERRMVTACKPSNADANSYALDQK